MNRSYRGVKGGTATGPSLCSSCRYGATLQGRSESDRLIYCSFLNKQLPFEAWECSFYEDKAVPPLHELEKIAWIVAVSASRAIGFAGEQLVTIVAPKKKEEPAF